MNVSIRPFRVVASLAVKAKNIVATSKKIRECPKENGELTIRRDETTVATEMDIGVP